MNRHVQAASFPLHEATQSTSRRVQGSCLHRQQCITSTAHPRSHTRTDSCCLLPPRPAPPPAPLWECGPHLNHPSSLAASSWSHL
jgi:hypothetical protein